MNGKNNACISLNSLLPITRTCVKYERSFAGIVEGRRLFHEQLSLVGSTDSGLIEALALLDQEWIDRELVERTFDLRKTAAFHLGPIPTFVL